MAFKEDFIQGRALRSISAAWLNGIAKALNSLSIRFDPNAKQPRIEKPPMPSGRSGWAIVLPPYPSGGDEGGGGSTAEAAPKEWTVVKDDSGNYQLTTPAWYTTKGEKVSLDTATLEPDASKPVLRAKAKVVYNSLDLHYLPLISEYTYELIDAHAAEEASIAIVPASPSAYPGTDGVYYIYTQIGEFTTETTGEGEDAETTITGFVQAHDGPIPLSLPNRIGAYIPGPLICDIIIKKAIYQCWNVSYNWPDARKLDSTPVYGPDAYDDDGSLLSNAEYASYIELVQHAEDHSDGVLTIVEDE